MSDEKCSKGKESNSPKGPGIGIVGIGQTVNEVVHIVQCVLHPTPLLTLVGRLHFFHHGVEL